MVQFVGNTVYGADPPPEQSSLTGRLCQQLSPEYGALSVDEDSTAQLTLTLRGEVKKGLRLPPAAYQHEHRACCHRVCCTDSYW